VLCLVVIREGAVNGVAADLDEALGLVFVRVVDQYELCHVEGNHHVATESSDVSPHDGQKLCGEKKKKS
jgi:hypothetical protein